MSEAFIAYIDESGDEGFNFDKGGTSKWFVLSAAVVRKDNDLRLVRALERVRAIIKPQKVPGPKETLHFKNLRHESRLPYLDAISRLPIRTVSVLVHKPSLEDPEKYQSQKYLLYHLATRVLLERVSWLCRDNRKDSDGTVKIVFSNRSSMSYDDIREYLNNLKDKSLESQVSIHWPVICTTRIEAKSASSLAGLQIADAVASSYLKACQLSQTGFNEPRYAQMLRKSAYTHDNRVMGYGLKFYPRQPAECKEAHFEWLKEWK